MRGTAYSLLKELADTISKHEAPEYFFIHDELINMFNQDRCQAVMIMAVILIERIQNEAK